MHSDYFEQVASSYNKVHVLLINNQDRSLQTYILGVVVGRGRG